MTPMAPRSASRFTEEWLLSAISLVSEVIVQHGPQYGPWLDRLEHELGELKKNDPVARARRHLAAAGRLGCRTQE
jgi:hypothetical protein